MMNKLDQFIDISKSQVGTKENGTNNVKYSKYFDSEAWQFFNTKKNGVAPWCAIYIHWLLCQIYTPKEVRKMLGEPEPKENCGAGVKYFWNYLKAKGLTYKKGEKEPKKGDIIFFGDLEHVGHIEYVDEKIHTIEGNKSNAVKRATYTKTSTKIYGFARLNFGSTESYNPVKCEPAVSFDKYYAKEYEVTINCQLFSAVRKNMKAILTIKKGAKVRCYGYYTGKFLYVKYGTFEGYIAKNHLRG